MKEEVRQSTARIVFRVTEQMTAHFADLQVHRVCSTYHLAQEAEHVSRLAIESFFDEGENAVGGEISLRHVAMAPVGAEITMSARVIEMRGRKIVCEFVATGSKGIIARGTQTQLVVKEEELKKTIAELYRTL